MDKFQFDSINDNLYIYVPLIYQQSSCSCFIITEYVTWIIATLYYLKLFCLLCLPSHLMIASF